MFRIQHVHTTTLASLIQCDSRVLNHILDAHNLNFYFLLPAMVQLFWRDLLRFHVNYTDAVLFINVLATE